MATIEIRAKPQGRTLERYMNSWSRVNFIMGPLGSGKTIQSCYKLFTATTRQAPNKQGIRPTRWYVVRNTYPDLLETIVKDWLSLFGDLGRYSEGSKKPPTHTLDFFLEEDGTRVQAEIIFLALDRPEHVRKLRGSQVTGFLFSEIKELAKAIVDMCDLRHGRYPSIAAGGIKPTWHGMMGDTNAMDDEHWYYKLAEELYPEDWSFFKQPGGVIRIGTSHFEPNPDAENLSNLPDGYYVKGMEAKGVDWIAVNLANEYGSVMDGKPVYTDYNDNIHCSRVPLQPYRKLPLILGWDFGLTPACIITQLSPRGQLRLLDEVVGEDIGVSNFIKNAVLPFIANHYPDMEILSYGDPAGHQRAGDSDESTCFDYLEAAGIPTLAARTNNFVPRREAVTSFLSRLVDGDPAFIMSPTCKVTRKGFLGGYCYRRVLVQGENRYVETPDKTNPYSHPHDAVQYVALECDTPAPKQARAARLKRKDSLIEIRARSGARIHRRPASSRGGY